MSKKFGIGILLFIGLILVFWLIGSTTSDTYTPSSVSVPAATPIAAPATSTVFTLSVRATPFSASDIEVSGETNLPDGSVISILGQRIEVLYGESEERFLLPGSGAATATVKNGSYVTRISIDDRKVLDFIKTLAPQDRVKKLYPDVQVTASFYARRDLGVIQPASVLSTVGVNGENLATSPEKKVFGSLTPNPSNALETVTRVPLPFPYMNQIP